MSIYAKHIQRNLRKIIVESGMSAEKVAFGSGISKGAMSNYLAGKRTPPIPILEHIAVFLKRDLADFFKTSGKSLEKHRKHKPVRSKKTKK